MNEINRPKISVIVPVYNVEKYIHQCIDSILGQTYTDFELLLINDGSPDNCGAICDEYAAKDSRVRVFHQKNAGVSAARNRGLDEARGEWVSFVDSDDWIEMNYLHDLVINIGDNYNCLIFQGHTKIINGKTIFAICNVPAKKIVNLEFGKLFSDYCLFRWGMPFAKLYSTKLIRTYQLYFHQELHFAEDLLFMLQYIYYCDYVQLIDGANYNYLVALSGSLTKRYNSFESESNCLKLLVVAMGSIKEKYTISENNLRSWNYHLLIFVYRSINTIYRYNTTSYINEKKLRMQIINSFLTSDVLDIIKCVNDQGVKPNLFIKIQSYLLISKQIKLFDTLTNVIYFLRYKNNRICNLYLNKTRI